MVRKVFKNLLNKRSLNSQYDFRSSQSTADLLIVVSYKIAFNSSGATRAVAFNISSVFDTVWHAGLFFFFLFLSGFSFTDTDNSQDSKGREGTFLYSTVPLPPDHEHSDIYVQLCT